MSARAGATITPEAGNSSRSNQPNSTDHPAGQGGKASAIQTPANSDLGGNRPKAFDAEGAIGHAFTEEGAIGGLGNKVGGPLASDGMIGKNFNPDGAVGGTVQNMLGGKKGPSN